METKEHFFRYNPFDGHPDKITDANGFNYFFLGNGLIQVAIQFNKSLKGSPLGIIIMDPDKFGKKSDSFTYDEKYGFERTIIDLKISGKLYSPKNTNLFVSWDREKKIPCVKAEWTAGSIVVREEFFCHDVELPNLLRKVILKNESGKKVQGEFFIDMNISEKASFKKRKFQFTILSNNERIFTFVYSIDKNFPNNIFVENIEKPVVLQNLEKSWQKTNDLCFDNSKFNHLFNCSKNQIISPISNTGRMDASMWQYNLEWVRDACNVVLGCLMAGHFEAAQKILNNLTNKFIGQEGDTIDSSQKRDFSEVELDQNGILLYALWSYWVWTNDIELIKTNWEKIKKVANFVLQDVFWDKGSRLLKNCREYWERHHAFGATIGYELTYQIFPIIGLEKISEIAEIFGEKDLSKKWKSASEEIKNSLLSNPKFALIDNGHFIKRRKESSEVHLLFEPPDKTFLADGVPLKEENINLVEPDASESLPIAFELIDPKSTIAFATLDHLETLWNQRWNFGGYGRYNVKSEPDSPGPWPFATMFIARAYLENENQARVERILNWMYDQSPDAGSWMEFYGWRPVPPLPPISIIPWTWAEIIIFFIYHLLGIRPEKGKLVIRPKLLDLTKKIEAKIRIRNNYIHLKIAKLEDKEKPYAIINKTEKVELIKGKLILPYSEKDNNIQIFL